MGVNILNNIHVSGLVLLICVGLRLD